MQTVRLVLTLALVALVCGCAVEQDPLTGVDQSTPTVRHGDGTPYHTAEATLFHRPLSDWLDAQGTTDDFTPPIPDFFGWTSAEHFAAVDYAGLAAGELASHGISLGTTITGDVTEELNDDGSVQVTVTANARNALVWATELAAGDPATAPTVFGSRAIDILLDPSLPADLVNSEFKLIFENPAPGAPLPDVFDLFGTRFFDVKMLSIQFNGEGTLADGSPGRISVQEIGLFPTINLGNPCFVCFPVENIRIRPTP